MLGHILQNETMGSFRLALHEAIIGMDIRLDIMEGVVSHIKFIVLPDYVESRRAYPPEHLPSATMTFAGIYRIYDQMDRVKITDYPEYFDFEQLQQHICFKSFDVWISEIPYMKAAVWTLLIVPAECVKFALEICFKQRGVMLPGREMDDAVNQAYKVLVEGLLGVMTTLNREAVDEGVKQLLQTTVLELTAFRNKLQTDLLCSPPSKRRRVDGLEQKEAESSFMHLMAERLSCTSMSPNCANDSVQSQLSIPLNDEAQPDPVDDVGHSPMEAPTSSHSNLQPMSISGVHPQPPKSQSRRPDIVSAAHQTMSPHSNTSSSALALPVLQTPTIQNTATHIPIAPALPPNAMNASRSQMFHSQRLMGKMTTPIRPKFKKFQKSQQFQIRESNKVLKDIDDLADLNDFEDPQAAFKHFNLKQLYDEDGHTNSAMHTVTAEMFSIWPERRKKRLRMWWAEISKEIKGGGASKGNAVIGNGLQWFLVCTLANWPDDLKKHMDIHGIEYKPCGETFRCHSLSALLSGVRFKSRKEATVSGTFGCSATPVLMSVVMGMMLHFADAVSALEGYDYGCIYAPNIETMSKKQREKLIQFAVCYLCHGLNDHVWCEICRHYERSDHPHYHYTGVATILAHHSGFDESNDHYNIWWAYVATTLKLGKHVVGLTKPKSWTLNGIKKAFEFIEPLFKSLSWNKNRFGGPYRICEEKLWRMKGTKSCTLYSESRQSTPNSSRLEDALVSFAVALSKDADLRLAAFPPFQRDQQIPTVVVGSTRRIRESFEGNDSKAMPRDVWRQLARDIKWPKFEAVMWKCRAVIEGVDIGQAMSSASFDDALRSDEDAHLRWYNADESVPLYANEPSNRPNDEPSNRPNDGPSSDSNGDSNHNHNSNRRYDVDMFAEERFGVPDSVTQTLQMVNMRSISMQLNSAKFYSQMEGQLVILRDAQSKLDYTKWTLLQWLKRPNPPTLSKPTVLQHHVTAPETRGGNIFKPEWRAQGIAMCASETLYLGKDRVNFLPIGVLPMVRALPKDKNEGGDSPAFEKQLVVVMVEDLLYVEGIQPRTFCINLMRKQFRTDDPGQFNLLSAAIVTAAFQADTRYDVCPIKRKIWCGTSKCQYQWKCSDGWQVVEGEAFFFQRRVVQSWPINMPEITWKLWQNAYTVCPIINGKGITLCPTQFGAHINEHLFGTSAFNDVRPFYAIMRAEIYGDDKPRKGRFQCLKDIAPEWVWRNSALKRMLKPKWFAYHPDNAPADVSYEVTMLPEPCDPQRFTGNETTNRNLAIKYVLQHRSDKAWACGTRSHPALAEHASKLDQKLNWKMTERSKWENTELLIFMSRNGCHFGWMARRMEQNQYDPDLSTFIFASFAASSWIVPFFLIYCVNDLCEEDRRAGVQIVNMKVIPFLKRLRGDRKWGILFYGFLRFAMRGFWGQEVSTVIHMAKMVMGAVSHFLQCWGQICDHINEEKCSLKLKRKIREHSDVMAENYEGLTMDDLLEWSREDQDEDSESESSSGVTSEYSPAEDESDEGGGSGRSRRSSGGGGARSKKRGGGGGGTKKRGGGGPKKSGKGKGQRGQGRQRGSKHGGKTRTCGGNGGKGVSTSTSTPIDGGVEMNTQRYVDHDRCRRRIKELHQLASDQADILFKHLELRQRRENKAAGRTGQIDKMQQRLLMERDQKGHECELQLVEFLEALKRQSMAEYVRFFEGRESLVRYLQTRPADSPWASLNVSWDGDRPNFTSGGVTAEQFGNV